MRRQKIVISDNGYFSSFTVSFGYRIACPERSNHGKK